MNPRLFAAVALTASVVILAGTFPAHISAAADSATKYVQVKQFNDPFPTMADGWKVMKGEVPGAQFAAFDDSAWENANLGWSWQGMYSSVWFRKSLTLPPEAQGRRVYFEAIINDGGEVYANGELLGAFSGQGRFILTTSADVSKPYIIAIKGLNDSGIGAFTFAGYQVSSGSEADKIHGAIEDLRALGQINETPVPGWKTNKKDSTKFKAADFDDSAWESVSLPSGSKGNLPAAWYRTTIVIPEKINGFPTAGQELHLKVQANVDGAGYVNGEKAGDKFRGAGDLLLTKSAKPGDRFVVAVRVSEFSGNVRLDSARLSLPSLEESQKQLESVIASLDTISTLFEQHPSPEAKWIETTDTVLNEAAKLVAQKDKDSASFNSQLQSIKEKLKPVTALIDRFPLFIKGPYLQNVTQNSIIVAWQTAIPTTGCVMFGKKDYDRKVCSDKVDDVHKITLDNLETESSYHYAAVSGELASPDFVFRTAVKRDTPFVFDVWGDSQSDFRTKQMIMKDILARPKLADIDVTVGDVVSFGGDYEQWGTQHFLPIRNLAARIPLFIAIGNHEYGGIGCGNPNTWFEKFTAQPGNGYYYAFTYGNSRFIILNQQMGLGCTDIVPGTAQFDWLLKEFESPDYKAATFHFIFLHKPPFSDSWSGGYYDGEPSLRTNLVPLIEKYKIDILFSGHMHGYERGHLNGVYHIITGGAGGSLDDTVYKQWPHVSIVKYLYHFIEVSVNGNTLDFKAIDRNGNVFDSFEIKK